MEPTGPPTEASQKGRDINHADHVEWVAVGRRRRPSEVLGAADGYVFVLVKADAGYQGTPHEHAHAGFFYLIDGHVPNQGTAVAAGDGYAASAGSRHDQFRADTPTRYVSIFKL